MSNDYEPPKPPPPPRPAGPGGSFGGPAGGGSQPPPIPGGYGPVPSLPQHQPGGIGVDLPGMYAGRSLAPFGRRLIAWLIDWGVPWIVGVLGESLRTQGEPVAALGTLVELAAVVAWAGNLIVVQGQTGQSVGKRLMGIRVAPMRALDTPPGVGLALGRTVASVLNFLPCWFGWLWPVWDSRNQTFADKVVSTVVLPNDS